MKQTVIVCGMLAMTLGASSVARAQKPQKCVEPSLTFIVTDTLGLRSDGTGSASYSDGVDGAYAKMCHCCGTGDVVLSLDTSRRQMFLTLSDGDHLADRVDVTGVEYVTARCEDGQAEDQAVTIWASDLGYSFVKANGNNGSNMADVCKNADGSWRVTSKPNGRVARFWRVRRGNTYTVTTEFAPFDLTVEY